MKRLGAVVAGAALALAALPSAADEALQKVLDCMAANVPPTLHVEPMELESTDRGGGSRTLKGRLYAMRDKDGLVRANLHIDAPDYLAGAAYLLRQGKPGTEDEMYVFLPSVNRVRRVVGDAGYDSLLGTDFSYVDLKQMQSAFGGAAATLEAPQALEQRPAYVLSFKSQPGTPSPYSLVRMWVDQKTCVAVKADFYQNDTVSKQLSAPAAALRQSGRYWYLGQAQMRDLQKGTSSQLRVLGVDSTDELPTRLFEPRLFYLGH
jgi:hypothetical protein